MIIIENLGMVERRYSDKNVKLRKVEDGTLWDDAVDIIPCQFTYEETDLPAEFDPIDPQDALDAIFGGEKE